MPPLTDNQIHIWLVPLDQLTVTGLNEREAERARRIVDPEKRRLYSGGRIGLRLLLEGYTGIDRDALGFEYGERGKPFLQSNPEQTDFDPKALGFNYTVSRGYALYTFSWNRELGIDIEVFPRYINLALLSKRILGARESREWNQIPDRYKHRAMLACWTRKEAYGKLLGVGIRYQMHDAELFVDLKNPGWTSKVTGLFDDEQADDIETVSGVQLGMPIEAAASVMYHGPVDNSQTQGSGGNLHPELLGFMYAQV